MTTVRIVVSLLTTIYIKVLCAVDSGTTISANLVVPSVTRVIPDMNTYQQRKNLAQGMMDLALLFANANQLRYVLDSSSTHPYYYSSLAFIALSILLQILVGVGLIMSSRYNVNHDTQLRKADKINNLTATGIFFITIINVFITAFSVATVVCDSVAA